MANLNILKKKPVENSILESKPEHQHNKKGDPKNSPPTSLPTSTKTSVDRAHVRRQIGLLSAVHWMEC